MSVTRRTFCAGVAATAVGAMLPIQSFNPARVLENRLLAAGIKINSLSQWPTCKPVRKYFEVVYEPYFHEAYFCNPVSLFDIHQAVDHIATELTLLGDSITFITALTNEGDVFRSNNVILTLHDFTPAEWEQEDVRLLSCHVRRGD